MLDGQLAEDEGDGNSSDVVELHAVTHTWTRRQIMLFPRGHFIEPSFAWNNCGFIIVAGSINNGLDVSGLERKRDISCYDIGADTWTSLGNLTCAIPTAVCVLHGEYVYCQSGLHVVRSLKNCLKKQDENIDLEEERPFF
jgi:hypothetical protein